MKKLFTLASVALILASCARVQETEMPGWVKVTRGNDPVLGYSRESGVQILNVGGHAFKDLNRNGRLDAYEDWRLPAEDRARDLASQMSVEQIAGLMLYSGHQAIPGIAYGYVGATYGGKPFAESGALASDLSDQQKKFLEEDNLRAVLVTTVESPEVAAVWNNNVQAFVEGLGLGIPANNSSDPRNETAATAEFNSGAGGRISLWPTPLGLAATFDPELVREFGSIASKEYRALGIATALSPQIDLATEPRWNRFVGTFGEDPGLDTDMARAYVDGFQTTEGARGGWGSESVNAMIKHWPSGGPEEGGRDAHFNYGKYAVYPGGNLADHLRPFVEGAMSLEGGTGAATAVMPYYTISYGQDPSGANVGNSYSNYIINELLRGKYAYRGVVCTDWNITYDNASIESFDGKCWGTETLTVAQRHFEVLKAGVDQFGGNNDKGPVLEAYGLWCQAYGNDSARERFEQSAVRLLLNSFRTGLFENAYLDPAETAELVGNPEFMKAGYEAQLKSVVMLKNHASVLPQAARAAAAGDASAVAGAAAAAGAGEAGEGAAASAAGVSQAKEAAAGESSAVAGAAAAGEARAPRLKVYVPKRHYPAFKGRFGLFGAHGDYWDWPVSRELVEKYYDWTDDPKEADFALAMIQEPYSGTGYDVADRAKGGNGYVPISLQYLPYTASTARRPSIAGGDPKETFTDRSYAGKTVTTDNEDDLYLVRDTRKLMGSKPVIVVLAATKPVVVSEFEPYADAILLTLGVQNQAILDIVSGACEPSGLLPMQMPADMATVEAQYEDVPRDMNCHTDADGNRYDFAFGLNWSGVISDSRVKKYR